MQTKFLNNNKGFTLLELAIVTMIIGFLALMAAPSLVQKQRTESIDSYAEELNWTLEAARRYFIKNGVFPANFNDLLTSQAIPFIPADPFGGVLTLTADNTAIPKWMEIQINNGVAGTDYGNIITKRVPFAALDTTAKLIKIHLSEFMVWENQEIVYMGIFKDGDVVPNIKCPGLLNNHPFVSYVAGQGESDTPVYSFRTWVTDTTTNNPGNSNLGYQINCKIQGGDSNVETNGCLVWLLQVCH